MSLLEKYKKPCCLRAANQLNKLLICLKLILSVLNYVSKNKRINLLNNKNKNDTNKK